MIQRQLLFGIWDLSEAKLKQKVGCTCCFTS